MLIDLLHTLAMYKINTLPNTVSSTLPNAVSISPNGIEKTCVYLQLCRAMYWEDYQNSMATTYFQEDNQNICVYPLLQSNIIKNDDLNVVDAVRSQHKRFKFSYVDCRNKIKTKLEKGETDWTNFWVNEICNVVKFKKPASWLDHLFIVDKFLKEKGLKVIFLFDGIEEIFTDFTTDLGHQIAIEALLGLPRHIVEIDNSSIGMIIFIRRDSLPYVITQNLGQFEHLYREFAID
jgi:hypothetical protein